MNQKRPVSVEIPINGKIAVPLRALPLVTNWVLHPFPLSMLLCGMAPPGWESLDLAVYQLIDGGPTFRAVPRSVWPDVATAIRQAMHDSDLADTDERLRIKLVGLLPAATFVWKDDFEVAYRRFFSMLH